MHAAFRITFRKDARHGQAGACACVRTLTKAVASLSTTTKTAKTA